MLMMLMSINIAIIFVRNRRPAAAAGAPRGTTLAWQCVVVTDDAITRHYTARGQDTMTVGQTHRGS